MKNQTKILRSDQQGEAINSVPGLSTQLKHPEPKRSKKDHFLGHLPDLTSHLGVNLDLDLQ